MFIAELEHHIEGIRESFQCAVCFWFGELEKHALRIRAILGLQDVITTKQTRRILKA
jgi:hypothetical protein